ncbi:hypothetical protein WJX75_002269 [Coccomyxa subellipsoidea]|uniref:Uncharacterized protein n=1 Tax=Coccomyxa subellipsoidea TaxID=248742 RepID=A0ABR2Z207_9CHLO
MIVELEGIYNSRSISSSIPAVPQGEDAESNLQEEDEEAVEHSPQGPLSVGMLRLFHMVKLIALGFGLPWILVRDSVGRQAASVVAKTTALSVADVAANATTTMISISVLNKALDEALKVMGTF